MPTNTPPVHALDNHDPVSSSNIFSIGHHGESQTLEVTFTNGNTYRYFDVPGNIHADMLAADSVGRYFAANVRNKFVCRHAFRREMVDGEIVQVPVGPKQMHDAL